LKELYLGWNGITHDGLTWLLKELSSTSIEDNPGHVTMLSNQFKGFGFHNLNNDHIMLLSSRFQNLESLRLENVQHGIDLTRLVYLKYLSKLVLRTREDFEELLKLIGPQLKCLNIPLNSVSSMKWIQDYCFNVQCLHLSASMSWEPTSSVMEYIETHPLPEFSSVKSLHLSLHNRDITDYILSGFVNVKKLSISRGGQCHLFEDIIMRKQLRHLEQFFWGDKTLVEFTDDEAIITRVHVEGFSIQKTQTLICSFAARE
jgi:hypothetical protein